MLHIMKKIAMKMLENEKKDALDCSVSDEVVDEWLDTIEERKKRMQEHHKTDTEQYDMLLGVEKEVKKIKEIRAKKCTKPD
ncbi:hypothetical protein [Sulfurimonas autotrophica]|uniref:Uncharacterized protein n=1 Tax=Sulfurimonas autotrophica (strain ATCC BAA-671 / DSM 16294 / JCM 11897 / OK10) TaxID=563040 RepID=E0UP84_SULAO|nr:hypothetical protein [Sulfurimonas autotrophica]ADN08548.1 conserved hypothetical protein [Sulfurimonas autotrophica DSM 16294]